MDTSVAKIVVGLATLGPGIGLGLLAAAYCNSVARQPELKDSLFTNALVFAAIVEVLGLIGFVAVLLKFV